MVKKDASQKMKLKVVPLSPDRWEDFTQLFGPKGACGGCWCMAWRLKRSDFQAQKGDGNRQTMHRLVESGTVPGLLAYQGTTPVGWCALAPRSEYPVLARSRVLRPIDDTPVWSVSCLFVAKESRNQGVSVQLLKEAIRYAGKQGALVLEGYPVEPQKKEIPAVFAWTGLPSAFLQAGFHEVARGSPTRPIMRYDYRE